MDWDPFSVGPFVWDILGYREDGGIFLHILSMNDLSTEEIITMLYGIKMVEGLSRTAKEVIQAAIERLEKGEEDERRNNEGLD